MDNLLTIVCLIILIFSTFVYAHRSRKIEAQFNEVLKEIKNLTEEIEKLTEENQASETKID